MFLANVRYGSQPAIISSTPAHTGITSVTKICVTKPSQYVYITSVYGRRGGEGVQPILKHENVLLEGVLPGGGLWPDSDVLHVTCTIPIYLLSFLSFLLSRSHHKSEILRSSHLHVIGTGAHSDRLWVYFDF